MAYILKLPTFSDNRGSLTVIEKVVPFEIKRVYYIYNATAKRGGHRHKKTWQALISVVGSCEIYVHNGREETTYLLERPDKCLVLAPEDWHTMDKFTSDCVLLVLASEYFDVDDYIYEGY